MSLALSNIGCKWSVVIPERPATAPFSSPPAIFKKKNWLRLARMLLAETRGRSATTGPRGLRVSSSGSQKLQNWHCSGDHVVCSKHSLVFIVPRVKESQSRPLHLGEIVFSVHIAFSFSSKCLQRSMCMQHGNGVNLTFLCVVAVLHGFGASSACDTASPAIGTSRGITSDCERTCEKSLGRSARQDRAVDPNVLARAKISTTVLDNCSMSLESQVRRMQLCFILIMLCTGRAFSRVAIVTHGWKMQPWRLLLQAYSPTNARLV